MEGVHFHRLARGEDSTVLSFTVPDDRCRCSREVRATTLAELQVPVKEALDGLMAEMRRKGRSCASLRVILELEDGATRELEVTAARPGVRAGTFWELLRLGLVENASAWRMSAPVAAVHLEVVRERRGFGEQGNLFGEPTSWKSREHAAKLEAAVGWLQALYGDESVVRPTLRDSHRPECQSGALPFRLPYARGESALREEDTLSPALRILNPPQPLEVRLTGRRLESFRWSGGRHRVRSQIGPRRLSGEWWNRHSYQRDYFELLTTDGGLFWAFFSPTEGKWFLQGLFD